MKLKITQDNVVVVAILIIIVAIGVAFSVFFSNTIDKFIYHTKTDPVDSIIQNLVNEYFPNKELFTNWQNVDSQQKFIELTNDLKTHISETVGVNIYDNNATLVWSNIKEYQNAIGTTHEAGDIKETIIKGELMKDAGSNIKKEIGVQNLLEIYEAVNLYGEHAPAGVIEVYFNTSDVESFIFKLRIFTWIIILGSIFAIFLLLRFAFNKQNKKIKEYSFDLEKIVDSRTAELTKKLNELRKFQELTVDREIKMIELKKEIEVLKKKQNV